MAKPCPTIQSVATKAGVSAMTVSRALRNQPRISPATKERILKIAAEMGYRPNPMVSTLMAQLKTVRSRLEPPIIYYVTDYPDPALLKLHPMSVKAIKGAQARAQELGYRAEYFSVCEDKMTPQRASKIMRSRGVAGLIVSPMLLTGALNIEWNWFSCCAIGFSLQGVPIHRAVNDQLSTVRLAYQSLRNMGYTRIGLAINLIDDERVQRRWTSGFLVEQSYASPPNHTPILRPVKLSREVLGRWIRKHKVQAVITIHDCIKEWIDQLGYRVPEEISVAHLDCDLSEAGLSGTNQYPEQLGRITVDLVIEQIHRNERGLPDMPKVTMTGSHWQAGISTPA